MLINQKKQKNLFSWRNEPVKSISQARGIFCGQSRKGFTLIEVLIVIVIIAIMTGVISTNLSKNKGTSEVEIAALQTVAQLRSLQNDAINGKSIETITACQFLFEIANGAKLYTSTFKDCATSAVIGTPISTYFSAKKENGSVTSNLASLYFTSPLGGVNFTLGSINPATGEGQIILTSSAGDVFYVCVTTSGNIFAQKNACF
ncbi:MAG: prepilin-type N-terminal cleavage/methylation domain-containing protein [Candidatus Moraniibacteriota bacterium]